MFLEFEGPDCLKRIKEFPRFTLDTTFTPVQEKDILQDIYKSTNGQQWYEASGWNSSSNEIPYCSWYGITCHYNTSYVKSIVLPYNNLDGFLPSNIWKIRNLFSLCTPGNPRLRGRIGDFLFGNMSKLLTISFTPTSISGDIPKDVAKLTSLQNFLGCPMYGAGFSGRLPENIGNMTELRVLCLEGNVTGEIPRNISRLERLYDLDIRNTPGMMHGNLSEILAIPSLSYLYLSGLHLSGGMPRVLPKRFLEVGLTGNSISGRLPETFESNINLMVFNVANNQLVGDIPGDLLLLPNRTMIDVSQSQFSSINHGKRWPVNSSAAKTKYVSLAGNRNLSIHFQSFLELFVKTASDFVDSPSILNISFCDIKSPVPANLYYFETMSTCDMRGNNFYGPLPDFSEDFSLLTYFDVSSNNLTGSFPAGIQHLISLQYLDISGHPFMREGTVHLPVSINQTFQE